MHNTFSASIVSSGTYVYVHIYIWMDIQNYAYNVHVCKVQDYITYICIIQCVYTHDRTNILRAYMYAYNVYINASLINSVS